MFVFYFMSRNRQNKVYFQYLIYLGVLVLVQVSYSVYYSKTTLINTVYYSKFDLVAIFTLIPRFTVSSPEDRLDSR